MDDQTKKLLAAAVVGGYVLGRTKKGRLALMAATFLAGRKLGLDPRKLAVEGARRIGEVPQVAELQQQLREEGLEAGRKALQAVADRSLGSLTDAIGKRTAGRGLAGEDEEAEEEEEEDDGGEEEAEDEETEEESPRRRRGSGKPASTKRGTEKTAGRTRKAAPSKASAVKKPAPARKTATSSKRTAKKTSGHADRRRQR